MFIATYDKSLAITFSIYLFIWLSKPITLYDKLLSTFIFLLFQIKYFLFGSIIKGDILIK